MTKLKRLAILANRVANPQKTQGAVCEAFLCHSENSLIMMKNILKQGTFWLATLAFCVLLLTPEQAEAQRGKTKLSKYLKEVPQFFVNDNRLSRRLQAVYRVDATRLALREINKMQRLSKQTVKVPEKLVKGIYNALVAVRTSDYGAIDSIARIYNVRTFPVPNVNYITLVFEHDAPWAAPLRRRVDTTASPAINNLIRKYNLRMTKMVYLDEERAGLVLRSESPINIPALSRKFFTELGIGSIEEMLPFGDGNDIEIALTENGWEINYSVRFGNCLNQCKKRYDWYFVVDPSQKGGGNRGLVQYKGGRGAVIPPWLRASSENRRVKDVLKPR